MKIGILYICTGVYDFFWKSFYLSAERYFLQEYSWNREYFVFTDSRNIPGIVNTSCSRILLLFMVNLKMSIYTVSIRKIWDGRVIR